MWSGFLGSDLPCQFHRNWTGLSGAGHGEEKSMIHPEGINRGRTAKASLSRPIWLDEGPTGPLCRHPLQCGLSPWIGDYGSSTVDKDTGGCRGILPWEGQAEQTLQPQFLQRSPRMPSTAASLHTRRIWGTASIWIPELRSSAFRGRRQEIWDGCEHEKALRT